MLSPLVSRLAQQWSNRAQRKRLFAYMAVILGAFALATGWIFASSPGSSPDDDFHLVSTWCPRPIESSGCQTEIINGDLYVHVPTTVSRAACEAFAPHKSHTCINEHSDDQVGPSYRYDDGAYPIGFYHFHHLFVGHSAESSIWHMRAANVAIAALLLTVITCCVSPRLRVGMWASATVAWAPMGFYFIASNNPSSWAITGVFAYGAALYGALTSHGWRRWVLVGTAFISSLLCFASRGDAAFYVFVVSFALVVLAMRRSHFIEAALALVLSVIGIRAMLGGGQASAAVSSSAQGVTLSERIAVAVMNIRHLPEYFAGFAGLDSGPGWRDTTLPGYSTILALLLLGAVIFYGARARMTWRKALSLILIFGAMAGIPLLLATPPAFPNLGGYHSRYALPLLGVWLLVWVGTGHMKMDLTRTQVVVFVFFSATVNAVALHTTIARYSHGLDFVNYLGWLAHGNLNTDVEWWWGDLPLSPMALWLVASIGYMCALSGAFYLLRSQGDKKVGKLADNAITGEAAHQE